LLIVEQVGDLARVFRRDILAGNREFVRDIRVQDPGGVTDFDILVSRDAQAYAYTKSLRLANVFVVEGLR
jgi:hypothetical protein